MFAEVDSPSPSIRTLNAFKCSSNPALKSLMRAICFSRKVVENFLANPFNGGNELEWETKIIIPFAKE